MKKQNKETITKNKALYSRYKYDMLQVDRYKSAREKLSKERTDTILFSEKIASQLGHKNKLNGTISLKDLPSAVNNNNVYFFTEQKNNIVKAVKIGDDIVKGKVPIYYLKVESAGKPVIKSVSRSDEVAYLYARKEQTVSRKNLHPIMQEAYKNAVSLLQTKFLKLPTILLMTTCSKLGQNGRKTNRLPIKQNLLKKDV